MPITYKSSSEKILFVAVESDFNSFTFSYDKSLLTNNQKYPLWNALYLYPTVQSGVNYIWSEEAASINHLKSISVIYQLLQSPNIHCSPIKNHSTLLCGQRIWCFRPPGNFTQLQFSILATAQVQGLVVFACLGGWNGTAHKTSEFFHKTTSVST